MIQIYKILGVAAALLLVACKQAPSPTARITEVVPADAPLVIAGNADAVLKGAGCRMVRYHLAPTSHMKAVAGMWLSPADSAAMAAVAHSSDVADLRNCIIFAAKGTPGLFTVAPLRRGAHVPHTAAIFPTALYGDAKAWPGDETSTHVLFSDSLVWTVPVPDLAHAAQIADSLSVAAADSPLGNSPLWGLSRRDSSATISVLALLPEPVKNPVGDDFDAAIFSLEVQDLFLEAKFFGASQASGEEVNIIADGQPIGRPQFFTLPIPPTFNFSAALSKDACSRVASLLAPDGFLGALIAAFLTEAIPPEGGAVAAAIAPGGSAESLRKPSLDSWLAGAMLPIGVSPQLMSIADRIGNITIEESPDSAYSCIFNFDPADYDEQYYIWPIVMISDCMQATLSIPYLSETMKALGIRHGYVINAAVSPEGEAVLTVKVNGTTPYVLPALLEDLAINYPIKQAKKWKR